MPAKSTPSVVTPPTFWMIVAPLTMAVIVVFGLIAATGGRIWVRNRVDFARPRNLITAGVALTAGAGDLTLKLGGFALGGIGTATFGAILLYHLLGDPAEREDEEAGATVSAPGD